MDEKKIIHQFIREGKSLGDLAEEKGIKFVTPLEDSTE